MHEYFVVYSAFFSYLLDHPDMWVSFHNVFKTIVLFHTLRTKNFGLMVLNFARFEKIVGMFSIPHSPSDFLLNL